MEITKKELKKIYNENSLEEAAKMLNVSVPTLLKYVKEAKISLKGKSRKIRLKN